MQLFFNTLTHVAHMLLFCKTCVASCFGTRKERNWQEKHLEKDEQEEETNMEKKGNTIRYSTL